MVEVERGRITDEDVDKMRHLIGYPNPTVRSGIMKVPWNTEVTSDAIRHYAECSFGDVNPLFIDPAYARASRWGTHFAPPSFELTTGHDRSPETPPDLREQTRGVLRSVQLFNAGRAATYFRPICVGDVLHRSLVIDDVEEKASEYAGRSVLVTNLGTWVNQRGETVCTVRPWYIHAERRQARHDDVQKYSKHKPAFYTDEDVARMEAAYEQEFLRGADAWYWEDVEVGQSLPTMLKGPLSITDQINMYMGAGWTGYGNPPGRLAYENRKSLRKFYTRNEFNWWDTIQRVHWDVEMARAVGVHLLYDIGPMRFAWINHYCTSLMGDDAWLYKIRGELRRFNYVGDATWITGWVTSKTQTDASPSIEIEIRGTNQRGEVNVNGTATILLPSRRLGPVQLPAAPLAPFEGPVLDVAP